MAALTLDDIPVCKSALSLRKHRAAPAGLMLDINPQTQSAAMKAFAEHGDFGGPYNGIVVKDVDDLGLLDDCESLLYLELRSGLKKSDVPRVEKLYNLRGLRISDPKAGIDFGCFPQLEEFLGDWHAGNSGIGQCRELRELRAWRFKPTSKDLAAFAGCVRLEQLTLIQTTIESLSGIEALEDLRYLDMAYAANVTSLEPLADPAVDLREIAFQNMKKIADYAPLASISKLRRLKLSSCAPMPDLRWTAGMDALDFFSFVETSVKDNDLTPLLNLPRLRYVGTMNKRSYSHTAEAIMDELEAKRSAPN